MNYEDRVPHPCFVQPKDLDAPLWRYMDISKFIQILQSSSLYFARADNLGDPFEGTPTADYVLKHFLYVQQFIPEEQKAEFHAQHLERYEKNRQDMFVSCWHMNEYESAGMWSIYSKTHDSICIRTTYRKLCEHLPAWVEVGLVKYIDYDKDPMDPGNIFEMFTHKRKSFEHEREVRAIAWSRATDAIGRPVASSLLKDGGIKIQINSNTLIDRVYVNPLAPDWFFDIVTGVIERYGLETEIGRSSLSAKPFL